MKRLATVAVVLAALGSAGVAHAALSIGVSTPTAALALTPGQTATATGAVVVTPGIGTWQLSVADTTGNAGHLAKAAGCPSYAAAQTANALTVRATGPLTTSQGTQVVGATPRQIAGGTLGDNVSVLLSLAVLGGETLPVGCTYSTTLTYTLQ